MENQQSVVKEAQVTEEQTTATVTGDVTTQADKVDRNVYEKVREAMQQERTERKAKEAQVSELEERLAKLEQTRTTEGDEDYDPYKAKTDILFLMNKDPFVKENLDLIEQKMTDSPGLDVASAAKEVKAEMFDRIQKEVSTVANPTLRQEKTTAIQEETNPKLTGNVIKDALGGKIENVPQGQLDAIKRVMGSLGK